MSIVEIGSVDVNYNKVKNKCFLKKVLFRFGVYLSVNK